MDLCRCLLGVLWTCMRTCYVSQYGSRAGLSALMVQGVCMCLQLYASLWSLMRCNALWRCAEYYTACK